MTRSDFRNAVQKQSSPSVDPLYYYSVAILSDIHLGKKSCSADMLYEFLQRARCRTLILNGDIVDGWALESRKHRKFPEMQKRVMDLINARIAEGMHVIYIPGNHDEKLRKMGLFGKDFFGFHFSDSLIHIDRLMRRFFILHGDQFDPQILKDKGRVLYDIGDMAYEGLIELNAITSKAAHKFLKKRFSIAAYAKKKTKNLVGFIGKFEDEVAKSARHQNVDGIFCGHIHHAELTQKDKILYGNSGDWVESCTALVCSEEGDWSVMRWLDERDRLGLTVPPQDNDANPYIAHRAMTERQLRLIQKIWPSKDRLVLLGEIQNHQAMVEQSRYTLKL